MEATGRLLLICSFAVSIVLCVGSKLAETPPPNLLSPPDSFFRLVSDGAVLLLHFIYLLGSRDACLAQTNESYQFLLDALGSSVTSIYAHLQFLCSIVANHYMAVCASDIILEYLSVLLQQESLVPLDRTWRPLLAVVGNAGLTVLNCGSVEWTTTTFAVYMKSLFMSFWFAKIWFNLNAVRSSIMTNQQGFFGLFALTTILVILIIATKEFACFARDVVSATHTVLLPMYERIAGIHAPEIPIIAACYGAGSLNSLFVSPDPFIKAAQSGQLPFALTLTTGSCSPVVLLLTRAVITALAVAYLEMGDLGLLGSCWDCLLLTSAVLFDAALLRARAINLYCRRNKSSGPPLMPELALHVGFQLANCGWMYYRLVSRWADIGKMLLFIGAVTIVVFKAVQSEPFVELCCNRLKLECCEEDRMALVEAGTAKPSPAGQKAVVSLV